MLSSFFSSFMEVIGLDKESMHRAIEKDIQTLVDKNKLKIGNKLKVSLERKGIRIKHKKLTASKTKPYIKKEKPMSIYKTSILPSYIYHMTHIDNLEMILKHGLFSHDNPYQSIDISDNEVNNRRSRREPIYGKSIHSYVPFYFNPKNPMLYVRKHFQGDIVILACENQLILKEGSLITDGNASSSYTRFGKGSISSLAKLNWHTINKSTDYYMHPKTLRERMAETLVPDHVQVSSIKKIICHNYFTADKVESFTNKDVVVDKKFYF